MADLVRLAGRIVWSAGAAVLLGLAVAWLAVGLVVSDAYGEQKRIDSDTRSTTEYDWATFTADPLVGSLFVRVWVGSSTGLFLLFTQGLWNPVRPDPAFPAGRTRPPLPPADDTPETSPAPAKSGEAGPFRTASAPAPSRPRQTVPKRKKA
ncbi:MAG: hypothetical protein KY455_04795 [Euryarchaeota archaeon]|nr:hypothetical protein [Euryarchaeota archaeon]